MIHLDLQMTETLTPVPFGRLPVLRIKGIGGNEDVISFLLISRF